MTDAASLPDRIDAMARRALGGGASNVARLTAGASKDIWSFDVDGVGFVLRRQPDGDRMDRTGTIDLPTEAAVICAAELAGVPIASVAHVLESQDDLGAGFVAVRMPGEALGKRIVGDPRYAAARAGLARQCGTILAAIHATPPPPGLANVAPAQAVDRLERQLRAIGAVRAAFEGALAWLRANTPPAAPPALVHGDFRTGNFLVTETGIAAVLDWEGCHLGDPIADLGWLTMPVWRFGHHDLPVGGFGSRADLAAGYRAPIDPARWRFWEVHGMLRWGLTCLSMADAVARGERSIERAAVGRRAVEAEIELLIALAPGGRRHG